MFFKSNSVRFLFVLSIVGMLILAGCSLAQPSASDVSQATEETVSAVSSEALAGNEAFDQIQDRSALADYQRQSAGGNVLADGNLWRFEAAESANVSNLPGQMPDQLADRAAVAEYQMHIGDAHFTPQPAARSVVAAELPNAIPDRQALAEHQYRLSGGNVEGLDAPEMAAATEMPGQIADRQALAEYQLLLSSGQIGR